MMDVEYYHGVGRNSDRDRTRSPVGKYDHRGRNGHSSSENNGGYEFYHGNKDGNIMNGRITNKKNKGNRNMSKDAQDDSVSAASLDSGNKRKSFRRLISRFAEKTSMVGVPYIHNAKFWWAKLIWSIMLLIAIGVMTLHLWYLIDQFFQFPIQTKVSLGFSPLDFPQVTICNTNHMYMSRLLNYRDADEIKQLVDQMKPENLVPDQYDTNYDPDATKPPEVPPDGGGTGGVGGGTQPQGGDVGSTKPPGGDGDGTQPSGGEVGGTKPPGGDGGGTQPSGGDVGGTKPPGGDGGGIKPLGGVGDSTPSTDGGGGVTQPPPPPPKRRKRFVDNYNNFNVSNYRKKDTVNPRDFEPDENEKVYEGEKDVQTEIMDLFHDLYMDIPKQDRAMLGHNISDMLISCTFNGKVCDSRMFQLFQTVEYGNCWSLTSDRFRVLSAGPDTGLTLILYLETTEYLKGITNGYGARIQVHERGTYPFPADEGLYIPASMETAIGLKMISIERMGEPYGTCDDGTEFQQVHVNKYTRRACQAFCEATTVINKCQCFDDKTEGISRNANDSLRPCRSRTEVLCMLNVYKMGLKTTFCTCNNPCSEVNYVKSVSQRQWPSDDYAMVLLQDICENHKEVCKDMRSNMDVDSIRILTKMFVMAEISAISYAVISLYGYRRSLPSRTFFHSLTLTAIITFTSVIGSDYLRNNFLKLNIYFEDLNFESITEDAEIEVQQFLSDVGGAIGLWIGLSILSLCEVVQLFIELCDYGIHKTVKDRRRERKKRRKERNKKLAEERQTSNDSWPRTDYGKDNESSKYSLPTSSDSRFFHTPNSDRQYGSRY